MATVLITPRSFGKYSREAFELLENSNIKIICNPSGEILSEDDMKNLVQDVDGIIVGVDPLNNVLPFAKKLKVISKYGVGLDNVDVDYCKKNGIDVKITLNANSSAVSDHAFALMLCAARNIVQINAGCHKSNWSKQISLDIFGKKIGILGLGSIGRGVVDRARGFNMKIYGYDIFKDDEYLTKSNIIFSSVEKIFEECDFISVHLPLTNDTKHLINEDMLAKAKKNLVIVNTSRGGIIDEEALYEVLKENKIYAAALDVFEYEPPKDSKLLNLENVVATSHSAASTFGAVDKMSLMAAENIIESFKNKGVL